jgi:TonB-dependent starch-binding outer membrane protein SusC
MTIDYYQSKTDNQLVGLPLPPSTGASYVQANFNAVVQNTGWEFAITSVNIKNRNFTWSTTFNITAPRNKLLKYPGIEDTYYANTYEVGKSLGILKAFHYQGVDPSTGVFQFQDVNKDGSLTYPEDLQSYKSLSQKYYGGFENTVVSHGFQLVVLLQFVNQTATDYIGAFKAPGFMANQPAIVMERWQKPGDISNIQKFTQARQDAYQGYINTIYYGDNRIGDASFIRLKNVSLSWQVPESTLRKFHLEKLKIYVQGQNLITMTHYLGMDPENQNAYAIPLLRTYVAGIQLTL